MMMSRKHIPAYMSTKIQNFECPLSESDNPWYALLGGYTIYLQF
jgi:hypothetical protein